MNDNSWFVPFASLVIVSTSAWVYFDAKSIGVKKGQVKGLANLSPLEWFLGCLFLWIIALPFYLASRSEFVEINQKKNVVRQSSGLNSDEKKCPYCAETIKREAKICRFCGNDLASHSAQTPQAAAQPTAPQPVTTANVINIAGAFSRIGILLILLGFFVCCAVILYGGIVGGN